MSERREPNARKLKPGGLRSDMDKLAAAHAETLKILAFEREQTELRFEQVLRSLEIVASRLDSHADILFRVMNILTETFARLADEAERAER